MGEISNVTNIEQIKAKRDKATAINEKKTRELVLLNGGAAE